MRLPLFVTRPRPWWALWLLAGVIYWSIVAANKAMIVSQHLDGLRLGLVLGLLTLPGLLTFALLWILAVFGLWQWRSWPLAWRSLAALSPLLLVALLDFTASAADLAWPRLRFAPEFGTDLPADARELHAFFSSFPFTQGTRSTDCFAFQTSAAATKALLSARDFMEEDTKVTPAREALMLERIGAVDFPDLRTWPGVKAYRYESLIKQTGIEDQTFVIELMTDETMTKVFVEVSVD